MSGDNAANLPGPDFDKQSRLDLAFVDGYIFNKEERPSERIAVAVAQIAELELRSGYLAVLDFARIESILESEEKKSTQIEPVLSPGKYPLLISVAYSHSHGTNIAAAKLRVRETEPVRWEHSGSIIQTSSSMLCFLDFQALESLDAKTWIDKCNPALESALDENGWNCAELAIERADSNLVVFRAGYGGLDYPVFKGFDAAGNLVELCMDFLVLLKPVYCGVKLDNFEKLDEAGFLLEPFTCGDKDDIPIRFCLSRDQSKLTGIVLEVSGALRDSLSIDYETSSPLKDSLMTYSPDKSIYRLDFDVSLADARLCLIFCRGSVAIY